MSGLLEVVEVGAGVDYLLLGGREPWTVDLDAALQRLRAPAPRAMLTRATGYPDRFGVPSFGR